jgi:hypothetical protein
MLTKLWSENLKERNYWDDLGIDRSIKTDLNEIGCKGVNWIHLARDMNKWRALENSVMNLCIPQKTECFLSS